MNDPPGTVCYECGATYGPTRKRCECGEPVWFEPIADAEWSGGTDPDRGVWRYADRLPVPAPTDPRADLGAATGSTPLVRTPGLDEYAGATTWVKDETANPTGTFKDRGTAVAVAAVREREAGQIGTVSHGNMATSTAAFAASAGLDAVVLVPADVSAERLAAIAQYDPRILRVDGDYGRLYFDALALADEAGVEFVNSDTPLRVAGQKTVAYEIAESYPDGVPDAVCLPVSSGGHASAVWKGFRELADAGAIAETPRIYLAQAAACDPIARAYRTDSRVSAVDPDETAAYSIANPDPPSGNRALAAVRETGGAVVAVDETAIRTATDAFARRAGFCVEPSSAVALAGLLSLSADGAVTRDDDVAVIATGTGFKELGDQGVDAPVVDLSALPERLARN